MKLYIWRYQGAEIAIEATELTEAKRELMAHLELKTGHLCIALAMTIVKHWDLTIYQPSSKAGLARDVTHTKSYPDLGFTLA